MANSAAIQDSNEALWAGGRQPFGASWGKLYMWFFLMSDALTFSGFLVAMGIYRFKYEDTWPVAENVFTHFPFLHGDHPLLFVALMTFILIMSSVTMVMAVVAGHQMNRKGVILWLGLTIIGGFTFLGSQAWEWYHFINGDKGAIMLNDGTITYLTVSGSESGEIVSLSELMGDDGAHGHHPHYTTEEVRTAFASSNATLRYPGKANEIIPREAALKMMDKAEVVQGASLTRNEYGNVLFADFFFFVTGFHGTHVLSGVILNIIIFIHVIKGTYERRGHYEKVEKIGLYWHFVDLVWVFVFTFFYLV